MSTHEREIIEVTDSIRFQAVKLEIHVGPESTRAEVMREVNRVCGVIKNHEAIGKRLGLLLGHLMALVQDRELFKPEHETFEEYRLAIADKFGLSRATVSNDLMIARALPKLEIAQARRIPSANLTLIARVSKHATQRKVAWLLLEAETKPIAEFRQAMEKRGLIAHRGGNPGLVSIVLRVSKAIASEWRKFRRDRTDDEALGELFARRTQRSARRLATA